MSGGWFARVRWRWAITGAAMGVIGILVQRGRDRGWIAPDSPPFDLLAWAPSFFYVFAMASFLLALPFRQPMLAAVYVSLGALAYEFLQFWIPERSFDWADVAATVVGAAIPIGVFALSSRRVRSEI